MWVGKNRGYPAKSTGAGNDSFFFPFKNWTRCLDPKQQPTRVTKMMRVVESSVDASDGARTSGQMQVYEPQGLDGNQELDQALGCGSLLGDGA